MRSLRRFLILLGVGLLGGSCTPTDTGSSLTTEISEPSTTSSAVAETTSTSTSVAQETTTTATSKVTSTTVDQDWEEGEPEAALATVGEFYTDLNRGDLEAALGFLKQYRAQFASELRIAVDGLNAQFEYDCTAGTARGSITCAETLTDDLYGPAGITHQATVTYHYSEGQLATSSWPQPFVCSAEPAGNALNFLMEFRIWSAKTHPELEVNWLWGEPIDSRLAIPCTVYPFVNEENAIKVCEMVPKFVAQADDWPLPRP